MRYVLKQKFWSWGDDFTIKNAAGEDVFFVDGKAFSWGDKLSFQDMSGNELAFIRQKLLSWGPTYEIEVHDRLAAVVKKKLFRGHRHGLPSRERTKLKRSGRRASQNQFANAARVHYRFPCKRREPRDHDNHLAFIPTTGVSAHASDRKSGAFLFLETASHR